MDPGGPAENAVGMMHTLYDWVRNGELVTHLLENLLTVVFLSLAAPLIDLLQKEQRERDMARDLKLYLDLVAL